ncbi:hypothetical protein NP493_1717g00010 [Ridgeia piscesae]|uniref:N-terminal kinase-like protein n=1 Tax=Ridgeia piscesae TaxID=27915 RepID=A0AAD9JU59_RIDPI|nr:hypothetical protein NP493_1717g00010 [Ridgeia piscesae]
MWSFFSRGGNDFPYVVGEEVQGTEQSIWSLHKGKHKSTEEEVSIFVFDVKGSSESQVQLAKASFKKMKTLRHPNILPFLDGFESDKVLYVVTECVVPLEMWINDHQDNSVQVHLAISWGLHQVARGLTFLINDCNLIHNNVCIASVLVDKSGEWKLGGLDYMYPATGPDCIPPVKILPALEKYDPPEKTVVGRRPGHKWSSDMWGLGCLIWEVFNGSLPRTSALKTINKIPKSLMPQYCQLVGANPKSRPDPGQFIKDACSKGGFIDNKFVQTMLFVEEIQIKDDSEKLQFFNRLPAELDSFPQESCRFKILPQLLHAFEFGNAGSAILAPLFKVHP